MRVRRYLWTAIACGFTVAVVCPFLYLQEKTQALPYHDSFSSGVATEWHALGGGWNLYSGGIRNDSDERGAKLLTGSPAWSDYSVEADVLLLGRSGDAGLIIRSSDEELGVDAYSGYYAGLRDATSTLAIGRADHGWIEYNAVPVKGGVHPFRWYHLKLMAVGCQIVASAFDSITHVSTIVALREMNCTKTGRIGLRSYSSGGVWKSVRVTAAVKPDLIAMLKNVAPVDSPNFRQTEAGVNSLSPYPDEKPPGAGYPSPEAGGGVNVHTLPLSSLRLVSDLHPMETSVRGSVVLTSPVLYIQDSTAGIEIDSPRSSLLKIGDEVEAIGTAAPRGFGAVLRNAKVQLLWSSEPAPPLSVTASQATTGRFDGMFIEMEGRLEEQPQVIGQSATLNLRSDHQSYLVIVQGVRPDVISKKFQPNSLLRLRGVCVIDPAYTKNLTAFVLLSRSSQDITVVAGPPWWDRRHLIEILLALMFLSFVGLLIFARAERWRLRAVLEERSRLAREIHDTLAQGFAGIALQLESALHGPRSEIAGSEAVEMAFHMAQSSRREAHRSIAALRTLHTDEPIEHMLQRVLRPQLSGSRAELVFSTTGTPRRLSAECESQLLRIAQEAVANAVQHTATTEIDVKLTFDPKEQRLDIIDHGQGFEPSQAPTVERGHFGIAGMKERAEGIKSRFEIQSSPAGTRVTVVVPVRRSRTRFWKSISLWVDSFKPSAERQRYS